MSDVGDDTVSGTVYVTGSTTAGFITVGGTPTYRILGTAVYSPPALSQSFGAGGISVNGSTTLSFTITNPNSGT